MLLGLLESWCARIGKLLMDSRSSGRRPSVSHRPAFHPGVFASAFVAFTLFPPCISALLAVTGVSMVHQGPKSILNTWRRRMQRLTSVTEQLKRKECRAVVTVLQSTFRSSPANGLLTSSSSIPFKALEDEDAVKQARFVLLRRWKELDVEITEAAVEAKVPP